MGRSLSDSCLVAQQALADRRAATLPREAYFRPRISRAGGARCWALTGPGAGGTLGRLSDVFAEARGGERARWAARPTSCRSWAWTVLAGTDGAISALGEMRGIGPADDEVVAADVVSMRGREGVRGERGSRSGLAVDGTGALASGSKGLERMKSTAGRAAGRPASQRALRQHAAHTHAAHARRRWPG